jgi:glycosyltransferase involved in cell wall biosynthesis
MNLLTAIVPIHKMSGRLEDLKQWVCESVKLDIRVVLVHDFGDTETEQELQDFVKRQNSPHITFISGNYGGPGLARNAAMHLINTRYFCFWDSDDIPLVENFYAMVSEASRTDAEIVVGSYETIGKNESSQNYNTGQRFSLFEDVAINPGIWRMAFQSEVFGERRFRKLRLAEDQLFLLESHFTEHKVTSFACLVYRYRIDSPASLTKQRKNLIDISKTLEVIRQIATTKRSIQSREFLIIMWSRLSLTLIKLGEIQLKLIGIRNIVTIIISTSINEKIYLVKIFIKQRRVN